VDIGNFIESKSAKFSVDLILPAHDFQTEWGRCSMLANYLARYTAYQYCRQDWAENLLSTITNDLLEAVVKVSPSNAEVSINCSQVDADILLEIGHTLNPDIIEVYRNFMSELCCNDIRDLYFQLLTDSHRPMPAFNQLGLAMLVHDFNARLATRLDISTGRALTQALIPTRDINA